ncbi:MAG: aminotransferase class I/II-fold pyridoxal phosphate-dependent enzyme, partial [Eudoraea sp.]|nr:aminotransferase class I/II-fold pyridoxal phosphate-dependent enzyme [Eudoraea sp.]
MTGLPKKLDKKLKERNAKNALRQLPTVSDKADFVSNDYLGMAGEEMIFHGAHKLLLNRGIIQNGSTGSRLLSGSSALYEETEQRVAEYYKADAALIFNSGYDANLGFFSSVPQRTDVVVFDEYIHASIRDGIRMGTAKSLKFKHNDLDDLAEILQRVGKDRDADTECYVVTEAVFSMDGDHPDLGRLMVLCKEHDCKLILDEAHAIQGIDNSIGNHSTKEYRDAVLFARIVTFGKAMGVQGSAILGSTHLKSYLINFARSFIYTTALPPMSVASILTVFRSMETTEVKERKMRLKKNIMTFIHEANDLKLDTSFIPSSSAIHSCIVPGNTRVKKIATTIQEKGYDVRPILSPT